MDNVVDFDSRKARDTMYTNKTVKAKEA